MKIGIINSGGDTQSLNAVIASAVIHGIKLGHTFVGFIKGWEGLLDKEYIHLDNAAVRGISHLGGTILYSVNKGRFAGKAGTGDMNKIDPEILDLAINNLSEIGIDALIVIGGDGTLSAAMQLDERGIKIIGVPKTIDNDLKATDMTFGFSTAINVVLDAVDRLHTTAFSHERVMFVETMGRHAGWIALHAGIAGGADAILLPEFEFSYEKLVQFLRWRKTIGRKYSIVMVSEGAKAQNEKLVTKASQSNKSEVQLGGITEQIMSRISEIAPGEFEMRNVVLGHIQRGGSPNAEDRVLAKTYGVSAITGIENKEFGKMVAIQNKKIVYVPIYNAVEGLNLVTKDDTAYQTAQKLGIFLGE